MGSKKKSEQEYPNLCLPQFQEETVIGVIHSGTLTIERCGKIEKIELEAGTPVTIKGPARFSFTAKGTK